MTEETVEPRPPNSIGFLAEGVIRPTRSLLAEFEGSSMTPVRVDISVDGSRTVTVDLDEEASLRLESIDVGVEPPDVEDAIEGITSVGDDDGSTDEPSGAIAFTVQGTIRDLPAETLAALEGNSQALESVTFSVSENVETDGGSPLDVLLDVCLFGYGVVVRRNGAIEIRSNSDSTELELV